MIHIFVNAIAASSGSGLTYVRNVVPHFAKRDDARFSILLSPSFRDEFVDCRNITFLSQPVANGFKRLWSEQVQVRGSLVGSGADILLSAGNFALRKAPVPQILLSGNSLYTSRDFIRDLMRRRQYRLWLDTKIKGKIARQSVRWADITVAPSQAFADELERWTKSAVMSIHHGFDPDLFFAQADLLPPEASQKLSSADGGLKLLLVSHYNYFRNFETLLRAMPFVKEKLAPRRVRLFLTCKLRSDKNPGSYHAERAAALVKQLQIEEEVVQLGAIPYRSLHHLYNACDFYVSPSYAETFAHPLVEAMACGRPVIASDLAVHREICGGAAVYFQRFDHQALADRVVELAGSPDAVSAMSSAGRRRSQDFSWSKHVEELLVLARDLMA